MYVAAKDGFSRQLLVILGEPSIPLFRSDTLALPVREGMCTGGRQVFPLPLGCLNHLTPHASHSSTGLLQRCTDGRGCLYLRKLQLWPRLITKLLLSRVQNPFGGRTEFIVSGSMI